ncbi:RagB/SusD family nutrient uptake outer membrane protein [Tenuifilum osseticum]|jgi:hypothetical protein|uniref:RagB/SusD family nutrient uptake outer membrane protein n=1 Tax=Tenuifilum osseticum TaxID=3374723 RepID=UPI0034E37618
MKKKILILTVFALSFSMFSCTENDLEPTLAQNKDVETSIKTVEDLRGVLNGMYNRITTTPYYGRDFIVYGEVRSDNCYANGNSGRIITPASMDMGNTDAYATDTWTQIYRVIASANIVISKKNAGLDGDEGQINHYVGQALAIRALAHFDLLKLYGQQHVTNGNNVGIPYIKEYKGSNIAPARNTVAEVKQFIYDDLDEALSLMNASYNEASKQYVTTYAVNAIKARVATYFGDWNISKTACEAIISSEQFQIVPQAGFVDMWKQDAPVNSIFELAYSSVDNNNINGLQYIYRGASYGDVRVLDDLLSIFEPTDVRASASMIGYDPQAPAYLTNLGKYPASDYSDDIILFRYEEVILNYAEALFELGQSGLNGLTALDYLNLIPAQRGASAYATITKDNILNERRRELCFEGFRFDDLARTGKDIPLVDPLNQRHNGPTYGSYNYAFPIPKSELNANPNMQQNYGYN